MSLLKMLKVTLMVLVLIAFSLFVAFIAQDRSGITANSPKGKSILYKLTNSDSFLFVT